MIEKYAALLQWLSQHGISPLIPLILQSMAAGWVLHSIFVELRKCFKKINKWKA